MDQISFANAYYLQTGDRLIRSKGGIFSKHHGIYVGIHNNVPMVAENQANIGVHYVSLSQFLNGEELVRIERFKGSEFARNQIITRINSLLGTQYDLIKFNCEHFAELIQNGKSQSSQVKTAVGVGFFALVAIAIFSKS